MAKNRTNAKTVPYMPLYVADYFADCFHLTTIQHGAYLLLLLTYWQYQKPLPSEDFLLSAIAKMPIREWLKIRPVIAKFFTEQDGLWYQKRCELELSDLRTKREQSRKAGILSAEARAQQDVNKRSTTVATDAKQALNQVEESRGEVEELKEKSIKKEPQTRSLKEPTGFDEFRSLMESTGKELNEQDFAAAAQEAATKDMGDAYFRDVVNPYIRSNIDEWRAKEDKNYVFSPVGLLKKTPWTRTAKKPAEQPKRVIVHDLPPLDLVTPDGWLDKKDDDA